jgi:hypothetical protein
MAAVGLLGCKWLLRAQGESWRRGVVFASHVRGFRCVDGFWRCAPSRCCVRLQFEPALPLPPSVLLIDGSLRESTHALRR